MRKNTLMMTVKALKLTFLLDSLLRKHDKFGVQFVTKLEADIKLSASFLVRYPVLPGFDMPEGIWASRMKHEVFINRAYTRLVQIFSQIHTPHLVESVCLGYKPHPLEHLLNPALADLAKSEVGRKKLIAGIRGPYQLVGIRHWAGMLYFNLPLDAKPNKTTVERRLKSLSRNASWTSVFEDLGLDAEGSQKFSDSLLKKYGTAHAIDSAERVFASLTTQPGAVPEPEEIAALEVLLAYSDASNAPQATSVVAHHAARQQQSHQLRQPIRSTAEVGSGSPAAGLALERGPTKVEPPAASNLFAAPKSRSRRAIDALRKGEPDAFSCASGVLTGSADELIGNSEPGLALQACLKELKETVTRMPEVRAILENLAMVLDGAPKGMSAHLQCSFVANFAPSAACE